MTRFYYIGRMIPPPLPENNYTLHALGDSAMTLTLGEQIDIHYHVQIMALRQWVEQNRFEGLIDCIAAYSSLTLLYNVPVVKRAIGAGSVHTYVQQYLTRAVAAGRSQINNKTVGRQLSIPVCYEGDFAPDMDDVCNMTGLTPEQVIATHTGQIYAVYMVGFLPGFAYMATVDAKLAVGRKQRPRASVEAGSVGVAGVQTGVYPVASPGGWQIIGRTPITLFNPRAAMPALLMAGDEVRFYSIDQPAYHQFLNNTI